MLATGQMREPMVALVGAKLARSKEPVGATIVDPANVRESAAGLALISFTKLSKDVEQLRTLLEGALKHKVTLIVYHDVEKVGSFGEKHVLTAEESELQRFALLNTDEGDAVLQEFSLKCGDQAGNEEQPRRRGRGRR